MIRGRVVSFKHYGHVWRFDLQPAFLTWDRAGWVHFERLRLVLADAAECAKAYGGADPPVAGGGGASLVELGAPPPGLRLPPPPQAPPPSPPRPSPPPDEEDDDEDEDEDFPSGAHPRSEQTRHADRADSEDDDEEDDDDMFDSERALGGMAGGSARKRPRSASPDGSAAADGAGDAAEQRALGLVDDDAELGSDDDDEEVRELLDAGQFDDAPSILAQYSKHSRQKETYKFDMRCGLLTEPSRMQMFREGKCELDWLEAAEYERKLRRLQLVPWP